MASLRRWTIRDALGQALAATLNEMTGGNDNAFTVRLKEPFRLLLDGLAKRSSLVPFIMPERTAKTDPFRQITYTVGSCPFKFVREEFEPGHRAVYVRMRTTWRAARRRPQGLEAMRLFLHLQHADGGRPEPRL